MRRRTAAFSAVLIATVAGGASVGVAPDVTRAAGPRPLFRLPFGCGQEWRASTHGDHAPHSHGLDLIKVGGPSNDEPVLIDHGGGWQTRYLHLISAPPVSVGEVVHQGQQRCGG
ncbi:M23 family metallopeptidase [Jidongwangia harbinensis]|uniref:M23 family metallopeptidase n=1 Tax=Jidongwangia harbinensis TaxID=2878561 RepID=UPI001CD9F956|nr:M23 family metallopeptidase [Jidongwangia harbinensis]MCA2215721.1 M23 family metallopeptidase [Jidongwangia harbinensis]